MIKVQFAEACFVGLEWEFTTQKRLQCFDSFW